MFRSKAGRKRVRIEFSRVAEIVWVAVKSAQASSVSARRLKWYAHDVGRQKLVEGVGVGKVADGFKDRDLWLRLRVQRNRLPFSGANQEKPPSILRDPEVGSVQHPVGRQYIVPGFAKSIDKFVKKLSMAANGQSFDVFENAVFRAQFANEPDVMKYQLVARVVEGALADHREALARCAAENAVNIFALQPCSAADFIAR
ncbi:MAG: hypothetical protein H6R10_1886 [Rhodocyclaceae bacterium]|nr:hypothetical protein [Rhodocyclaceae bacterium]